MTSKQIQLLNFIKEYIARHNGVSPSYDEMRDHMDVASKSVIHRLVDALEERGKIKRLPHRARSIVIVGWDQATTDYPQHHAALLELRKVFVSLANNSISKQSAATIGQHIISDTLQDQQVPS